MNDTILIAEDERLIALDIKHIVKKFGFKNIHIAYNAMEAYSIFREEHPDIILMDIIMDGKEDGIAAARKIHQESSDIPVIFITASTDPTTFKKAMNENPVSIVAKPFTEKNLMDAIQRAVKKEKDN